MLLAVSIEMFLTESALTREPSTMKAYRSRLNQLKKGLGHRELNEVTPDELQQWLNSQRTFADGRDKAPDTIRLTMISLDLFQAWLVKNGYLSAVILAKQRKPAGRMREILPEPEETREIFQHISEDFQQALRVLRLTGCRPGELARMRIEDYDIHQGLIILAKHKTAKKTGRPRVIAVSHPSLVEIIDKAINGRKTGHIFLRSSGRPWTVEALSAKYRKARNASGLPRKLVLYLARHEHATQLYEATNDLNAVSAALGHTNIAMSARYAKVRPAMLKKNQNHFVEAL